MTSNENNLGTLFKQYAEIEYRCKCLDNDHTGFKKRSQLEAHIMEEHYDPRQKEK